MAEDRRSARLRKALSEGVSDAPTLALIDEVCRLSDRLDDLDQIIAGKGVLNLLCFRLNLDLDDEDRETRNVHVKVEFSNVLAEARQQQSTFRQLLLDVADVKRKKATSPPASRRSALDELQARRDSRKSGT